MNNNTFDAQKQEQDMQFPTYNLDVWVPLTYLQNIETTKKVQGVVVEILVSNPLNL